LQPDDEKVLHEPCGMKISVEACDNLYRLIRIVRDLVKIKVIRRNQLIPEQMLANMLVPRLPVRPARTIDQHEWHQLAFAGLHQGQRFVSFIHGAEPSWEKRDRIRM